MRRCRTDRSSWPAPPFAAPSGSGLANTRQAPRPRYRQQPPPPAWQPSAEVSGPAAYRRIWLATATSATARRGRAFPPSNRLSPSESAYSRTHHLAELTFHDLGLL